MKWETLYAHYDEWPAEKVIALLPAVEDLEKATGAELADFAEYGPCDPETNAELIKRAADMGVRFSADDLMQLKELMNQSDFTYLLLNGMIAGLVLSPEQVVELDGYVSKETMNLAARNTVKHGGHFAAEQISELVSLADAETCNVVLADAIKHQVPFSADDILEIDSTGIDRSLLGQAALANMEHYSEEDIESLEDVVDRASFKELSRNFIPETPPPIPQPVPRRANAAMAALLAGMLLDSKPKQKNPRFHVGDAVVIKGGFGSFGYIIDVNDGLYMVRYCDGKYVSSFSEDEIEKTT